MSKLYISSRGVVLDTADSLDEAEGKVYNLRLKGINDSIHVGTSPKPTYWTPNKKELEG